MAQGRPLSRHGRYDAFKGMPLAETETEEFYRKADYTSPRYTPQRPKSGYKTRGSVASYDQYARVTTPSTPREEPPTRPESRRGGNGYGQSMRNFSVEDSDDESYIPSPPSQPSVSPEFSHQNQQKMRSNQPRPPSSSGRPPTSGRPVSGRPISASVRVRSARKQLVEQSSSEIPDEDLPDMSAARPPSSFSKYRPLPAIGTPTPPEIDETSESPANHLYNVMRSSPLHFQRQQKEEKLHMQQTNKKSQLATSKNSSRVSSAVSDISVISTRANSRSQQSSEECKPKEAVEKLDLSLLEKPSSDGGRRRKVSSHASPAQQKSKNSAHQKIDHGELYDGDDDDSDTPNSRKESSSVIHHPPKPSVKKPVVIPSPDHPFTREILLAVKLPTDGTRHTRYFNSSETLQSIVDFAEEVAGQDFAGYILVSSAPKTVYSDLKESIEKAGLEDKTVFHLEEGD